MTWEKFLQTIASDPEFRMAIVTNPKKALESKGVKPTPEMIEALEGLDRDSLEAVAEAFETGTHADTPFC